MKITKLLIFSIFTAHLACAQNTPANGQTTTPQNSNASVVDTNGTKGCAKADTAQFDAKRMEHILQFIKENDKDGDGKLNQQELTAGLEKLRDKHIKLTNESSARKLTSEQKKKIKEHRAVLLPYETIGDIKSDPATLAKALIAKHDTDGDGKLSADELTLPRSDVIIGHTPHAPLTQGTQTPGNGATTALATNPSVQDK